MDNDYLELYTSLLKSPDSLAVIDDSEFRVSEVNSRFTLEYHYLAPVIRVTNKRCGDVVTMLYYAKPKEHILVRVRGCASARLSSKLVQHATVDHKCTLRELEHGKLPDDFCYFLNEEKKRPMKEDCWQLPFQAIKLFHKWHYL